MKVLCKRDCYDNASRAYFARGEVYDLEPSHVLAKYFDFPPVPKEMKPAAPPVVPEKPSQPIANRFPKR
jgi:hypothetical protein